MFLDRPLEVELSCSWRASRRGEGRRLRAAAIGLALLGSVPLLPADAFGQLGGLSSVGSRRLDNPLFGAGGPQEQDQFAFALAVGDLDGNGHDDLAVGVPADDGPILAPVVDSGSAHLYLSDGPTALPPTPHRVIAQTGSGFEPGDRHGHALAICDFDADGAEDLAVGAMTENAGGSASGAVFVYRGETGGPSSAPWLILTQNNDGIPDQAETGDLFGGALACGDFDDDGDDDLAIGAPGESLGVAINAGWVVVLPGGPSGLQPLAATAFTQADAAIPGVAESDDFFGLRLAAGDFNGDGHDDLAIGAPGEDATEGAVILLLGGPGGLSGEGSFFYTDVGLSGLSETGDRFGDALAFGDFDGDGDDELAIGIPGESFAQTGGPVEHCGQIVVIEGAPSGSGEGHAYWAENNLFGPGTSESNDRFGTALASADFDGDGLDDLAIGHPGENVALPDDGAVTVVSGSPDGLLSTRRRRFSPGSEGLPGQPPGFVTNRGFGAALAAGDLNGDGYFDLVIGAPAEPFGDTPFGAATILFGALFADGFESSIPLSPWELPSSLR